MAILFQYQVIVKSFLRIISLEFSECFQCFSVFFTWLILFTFFCTVLDLSDFCYFHFLLRFVFEGKLFPLDCLLYYPIDSSLSIVFFIKKIMLFAINTDVFRLAHFTFWKNFLAMLALEIIAAMSTEQSCFTWLYTVAVVIFVWTI